MCVLVEAGLLGGACTGGGASKLCGSFAGGLCGGGGSGVWRLGGVGVGCWGSGALLVWWEGGGGVGACSINNRGKNWTRVIWMWLGGVGSPRCCWVWGGLVWGLVGGGLGGVWHRACLLGGGGVVCLRACGRGGFVGGGVGFGGCRVGGGVGR